MSIAPSSLKRIKWKNKPGCICVGLAAIAFTAWISLPATCASSVSDELSPGLGALNAPSLSPGHFLRPSALFLVPDSGAFNKGDWGVDIAVHWANIWNYDEGKHVVDGEWLRTSVKLNYTLTDAVMLGMDVPFVGRTGGFADSLIEGFHDTFGFGNEHREEFPRNQSVIKRNNGANDVLTEGDAWGIGDVSLSLAWRVFESSKASPALFLLAQWSVPTGDADALQGLGENSLAVGTFLSQRLGRLPLSLFCGLGMQYCEGDLPGGIENCDHIFTGLGGAEWMCCRSFSLIVQYLGSSPIAKNYSPFSDSVHEVAVGFKWRATDATTLQFAFVENMVTFVNSADVAAHAVMSHRF